VNKRTTDTVLYQGIMWDTKRLSSVPKLMCSADQRPDPLFGIRQLDLPLRRTLTLIILPFTRTSRRQLLISFARMTIKPHLLPGAPRKNN
jgi:hypothetical protein